MTGQDSLGHEMTSIFPAYSPKSDTDVGKDVEQA